MKVLSFFFVSVSIWRRGCEGAMFSIRKNGCLLLPYLRIIFAKIYFVKKGV